MNLLPAWLRIPLLLLVIGASTAVHVVVLLVATLGKALASGDGRAAWGERAARIAESWIGVNSALIDRCTPTRIEAELPAGLRRDGSYLVLANHQSWVDIPVLQYVFNRRIPFLRFFLKRELIWVPLLGVGWWALDFPFMQRYTREQIERRPELAGRDIDATRRACAKFREMPVAVMNFVEGTRYTEAKHAQRPSPHRHLLRPKAGGIAFVIDAMGGALQSILDVTIHYPQGRPSVWDLLGGRIRRVQVQVELRPVPPGAVGSDYEADAEFRAAFQAWVNALWTEKDATLERLRSGAG